jgi:hypothetical protein
MEIFIAQRVTPLAEGATPPISQRMALFFPLLFRLLFTFLFSTPS